MANNNIYISGAGALGKALAVSFKVDKKDVVILLGRIDGGSGDTENTGYIE